MLLSFVAVPYSSLSGSPSGLKRSSDNEFVLLTRSEINILVRPTLPLPSPLADHSLCWQTPALGVVADPLSRIAPLHKPAKGKERARSELPLFRTSFVVEKKDILEWAGWSNGELPLSSHWVLRFSGGATWAERRQWGRERRAATMGAGQEITAAVSTAALWGVS